MKNTPDRSESSARLFSVATAQEHLQVSRPTLQLILDKGLIRSIRIGRSVRIPESSIVSFIEAGGERHLQGGDKQ
jgi:excisionase family DNA binding protein